MKKGLFSVYNELHNLDLSFFDAVQSLFLIVYKDYNSTSKQFDEKANFTSLYESDPSKYQNEAIRYLNLCFEKSVPEYIRSINFPDFNPDKKLLHTEYALSKVEELPAWVKNWKEPETDDKKVKFIIRSGVNSNDSPIWNVRSGLMHGNFDRFNLGIAALEDTELLSNTLKWLKYKEEFNHMFLTASYLTPIYLKLENKGVNVKSLLIPVIHPIEHSNYMLIHHNESIEYHYRNTSWGDFAKIIIDSLDIEDKKVVDDVLSSTYRQQLNVQNETVTKVTDIEILKANSVPLSEFYYTQWPLKNRYPIWEYNGKKIPYNVKYKDLLLSSFSEELAVCVSDNYYVVAEEVANIPYSLRYILPEDAFQDLQRIKAEIEHQDAAELENVKYSDAETEALKKLFGNDIPEEFFKDLNLQACISALVIYGNKEGYNIEAAECNLKESHQFSQIKPIYAPGSTTPLTIMCRSARNGILHLTAQAWNRLDSADTLLFVKTGRMDADYFIFNNKNEVLEISKTNYQVFRVQTTSAAISTDSILKGTFSKDKIWLILKMRDRTVYKSIFDGNIREIESDPRWDNIDTSDI